MEIPEEVDDGNKKTAKIFHTKAIAEDPNKLDTTTDKAHGTGLDSTHTENSTEPQSTYTEPTNLQDSVIAEEPEDVPENGDASGAAVPLPFKKKRAIKKVTKDNPSSKFTEEISRKEKVKEEGKRKTLKRNESRLVTEASIEQYDDEFQEYLKEFELLSFAEQCTIVFNQYSVENDQVQKSGKSGNKTRVLNIDGLDQILRTLGQQSTVAELRTIMNEWGDEATGRMDFVQFVNVLDRQADTYKDMDKLEENWRHFLVEAFCYLDCNGDGDLSTEEISEAFKKIEGSDVTDHEIAELFREVDRNDDGSIQLDEWFMAMADIKFDISDIPKGSKF